MQSYEERKQRLIDDLRKGANGSSLRLAKATSNLFRDRANSAAHRLDVRDLDHVLGIDTAAGLVDVEGMTPYEALVDATLPEGAMPAVVPELRSITIGGAVAGLGIEASSFRHGLVHETIEQLEVLLPGGEVVLCTPDNEHSDLFFGFANSFGTLGYALRVKAKIVPVKPYVRIRHIRHCDPIAFFGDLEAWCGRSDVDFVEGEVFGRDEMYVSLGRFTDQAPYTSDYGFECIYYQSIREKEEDYLTTRDYIWRWDTDWFWCSKMVFAEHPMVRRLLGRKRLQSVTYMNILRVNGKLGLLRAIDRLRGIRSEAVIQDVPVPIEHAPEFLDFFLREVPILPLWTCPVRVANPNRLFDLFRMEPGKLYVNLGFWDAVRTREDLPAGHYNRRVERKVRELGGLKSLYSEAYYERDEFWELYNKPAYDRLKAKYDPNGQFKNLYDKCVLRQ
jgi:FAD/FMN-containing dehydrogenase